MANSYRPGPAPDDGNDSDPRREHTSRDYPSDQDYDRTYARSHDFTYDRSNDRSHDRTYDHTYDRNDRTYDRTRDQDHRRRRGDRHHDLRYQERQFRGNSYRDFDSGDYYGARRYISDQRMDYDGEGDLPGYDDRFDPRKIAPHQNFNLSDTMRYGKEHARPPSDGEQDKDKKGTKSRFLLIQNIKPSTTDELLAKGLEKLYRGADKQDCGARPMSLRSVIRIKSCTDNDRMGFAFAEYWTVQDAVDAHERSRRKDHQCTVSSQRFSTSFPHLGVFRPTSKPSSDGSTEESPAFFLESKSTWYNYYDERYYATITTINENEPAAEPNPLDKIDRTASDAAPTGSKRSANALENVQSKSKKPKTLDSGVPMLAQMQKWQDAAGELRGETSSSISGPQSTDEQTFAVDTEEHKRCYLCNTMFGASEALVTHLKKSAAHLAFAKDEKRRQKGFGRLEKNGVDPASTIKLPPKETATGSTRPSFLADQASAPQARDRAAERRQQEAAAPPSFSLKKAAAVSAAQKPRPGSSGSDAARPSFGVGRKMLQQAGWSEGQGLGGESGTGMAAPLEQQMFAAGVGLGHEGSRRGDAVEEAERATKGGRGDFAEMTRENARKRFGRM